MDYSAGIDGNNEKAFVAGLAGAIYDNKMGSCWWAGLWAPGGNTPDLLIMKGTGNNLTFTIQNQSSLDQIWHSWALK